MNVMMNVDHLSCLSEHRSLSCVKLLAHPALPSGERGSGRGAGREAGREAGRWGGQRRLAQAGGREGGGGQFYGEEKEASPTRMAYTGAVPPITSGFAKWPPFPAKLDHRGPMHDTLAGSQAMCV